MVVILRVFLIAVDGKSADVPPLPPLHVKNHADIFGQVLQIPLVDQAVDLPGLFVALYLRVGIVGYGDEPDAQMGNRPWMYFSTNSISRVKRDWLLQRII